MARVRFRRRRPCGTAEQAGEKIAEAIEVREPLAARMSETLRPIRGRAKLLTGPVVASQLIIGRALLGIAQHLIGFLNLFEAVLGVLLLADVRMILASQLAIGALDLVRIGPTGHAESFVIILILHAHPLQDY